MLFDMNEVKSITLNATHNGRQKHSFGFFVAGLLFFVMFGIFAFLIKNGMTAEFDWNISHAFFDHRSPGLNTLIEGITYLGDWKVIAILCLLLLLFSNSWVNLGIPVAACGLITTTIRGFVKPLVARPRPDETYWLVQEDGFSFPSGHSITSMGVFALLIFLLWYCHKKDLNFSKKEFGRGKLTVCTVILVFFAFAIGLSRIYVGVHFFTDVMAGWCAGLGVASCIAGCVVYMTNHPGSFVKLREAVKKRQVKEIEGEEERSRDRLR
jgi:undecaprenyl-diphosphatase